jgi:hypothetical protein
MFLKYKRLASVTRKALSTPELSALLSLKKDNSKTNAREATMKIFKILSNSGLKSLFGVFFIGSPITDHAIFNKKTGDFGPLSRRLLFFCNFNSMD